LVNIDNPSTNSSQATMVTPSPYVCGH